LIEMLAYVAILAVGVNLCGSLFVTGSRLSALNTLVLDRLNGMAEIEREFTQAVRESYGVVPGVGNYTSNDVHVVLETETTKGQRRYVVLGPLHDEEHLSKLVLLERDGVLEPEAMTTYRLPLVRMDFSYPPGGGRGVQLDAMTQRERGERRKSMLERRFVAAPRGIKERTGS